MIMSHDEIWMEFEWVIEELRQGMSFFEGLVPCISTDNLLETMSNLSSRVQDFSLESSVWNDETPESIYTRRHDLRTYIDYFFSRQILLLNFDYELPRNDITLNHKLIIEPIDVGTRLEIICYREPILKSKNVREATFTAIEEFRYLRSIFEGDKLFIGPDILDYPTSDTEEHDLWLRVE